MTNQEQLMQRYLLGELPEAEQSAFEQKYFGDQQLFDQLVRVEHELLDRYARGLLPHETRERFERYYLAHPRRRERAQFAEALAARLDQTDEAAAVPSGHTESLWGRLLASLRRPKLAWAISIALLLTAAGAVWLFIEARRLRQELAKTEGARATQAQRERELEQQVTDERQRSEQLSAELDRLRAEQQAIGPSPTPSVTPASAFATLVLTVAGMRGVDTGPSAVLVIPARTEQARLQLNLRDLDYSSYRAILQRPGGAEVFAWPRLSPQTTRTGARLTLTMPARRLSNGDYILTLRGASQTGEVEDVSKSLFRVEKR